MEVYCGNDMRPPEKEALVAIGTFDGVHRGHQSVLRALTEWAKASNVNSEPRPLGSGPLANARGSDIRTGVITFRQHPLKALSGRPPDLVTTLEHRLVLFERAQVNFAWVINFTPELASLAARQFAEEYLQKRLAARGLMMGFNSAFGSDRVTASSPELKALARELGFAVRSAKPVKTPDGKVISSTRIREAISEGRLHDAENMLGRQVSVYGTVIQGDARGRRLGFHTANLDLGHEVRPPFGVYATIALVQGARYGSVTNVGYRPTVTTGLPPGEKPDLLLETHLFDFKGDLYGQKMEVLFIEKLRDERRFPDVEALAAQIAKDEALARKILKAREKRIEN